MIQSVWILTFEINAYDQEGEYFQKVFFSKPTIEELGKYVNTSKKVLKHILNGGGRIDSEDIWFYLKEVKNE